MQENNYDDRYVRFFQCFNRQLFFEAHEALEGLWLSQRQGPNGRFYKGLIQLAGALVHLQKGRGGPAARLFDLARQNLRAYPATYEGLAVEAVRCMIEQQLRELKIAGPGMKPSVAVPELRLQPFKRGITRAKG